MEAFCVLLTKGIHNNLSTLNETVCMQILYDRTMLNFPASNIVSRRSLPTCNCYDERWRCLIQRRISCYIGYCCRTDGKRAPRVVICCQCDGTGVIAGSWWRPHHGCSRWIEICALNYVLWCSYDDWLNCFCSINIYIWNELQDIWKELILIKSGLVGWWLWALKSVFSS